MNYSNLVNATYELKDMVLQDVRDRLVTENNLTPLDILKGFHEKSKIDLDYESCLTDQNRKDIKTIQDKFESFLLNNGKSLTQEIYDKEFDSLFEDYKKSCPEASFETIEEYKNNNKNQSVSVQNETWRFLRAVNDLDFKLASKVKQSAIGYIEDWVKENVGEQYTISQHDSGLSTLEGLPRTLDVNKEINIDFSNVYEISKEYSGCFDDWIQIDFDSRVKEDTHIHFNKYDMVEVSVHIPEDKAKEVFNNAINSVIYKNNVIGKLEFFQNLEAQPITININTKTNKYELIDGYKRLLYVTDKKLLSHTAPVKFFTDLDDKQFLTLLYASNMWKSESKFHDRGYLFALKTRFGFEIPSSTYDNLDFCETELGILQLYDFGDKLARVDTTKLMGTLEYHKHLVSDVSLMYNFLAKESEKSHGYDENISEEVRFTIIEAVGELRRRPDSDSQNELSEGLISSIFEDDLIKKTCAKKHLSTRTYVINLFKDKCLYKHIVDLLKNGLINS